jgi:hypothetical protein
LAVQFPLSMRVKLIARRIRLTRITRNQFSLSIADNPSIAGILKSFFIGVGRDNNPAISWFWDSFALTCKPLKRCVDRGRGRNRKSILSDSDIDCDPDSDPDLDGSVLCYSQNDASGGLAGHSASIFPMPLARRAYPIGVVFESKHSWSDGKLRRQSWAPFRT